MPANPPKMLDLGIVLGAGSAVIGAFQSAMPKPAEVRKTSPGDDSGTADLRHSEVHAVVISLTLGSLASFAVGSWRPVVVAGIVSGVIVGVNEWSLRS